jgi:nicotinate-nucleotide pyrophosphorylase (carboxylating)
MIAQEIRGLVQRELAVDRVQDDVTARLLGEEGRRPRTAVVKSREKGVFCGEAVCTALAEVYGPELDLEILARDGQRIEPDAVLVRVRATVATCLSVERTLLNFLSHLCGIATLTHHYVEAVRPHRAKILATRKTLPGLREVQLQAVKAGGGWVHRRSLSDGILIKDNHLAVVGEKEILTRARNTRSPLHAIEIEVQNPDVLPIILENPPHLIMLDNLDLEQMEEAIRLIGGRSEIEASGGVNLQTVGPIAALGVDYISVGALTHSVKALDLTLDVE